MNTPFAFSRDQLRALAQAALAHAKRLGASDALAEVSESTGLSVSTRKMQVETIEHTRDKGLAVSVYIGTRRGHASTSDFSPAASSSAVKRAMS
jgi:PmbA protein